MMQQMQTAAQPALRQAWSDEMGLARAARTFEPMPVADDLLAILDGVLR